MVIREKMNFYRMETVNVQLYLESYEVNNKLND